MLHIQQSLLRPDILKIKAEMGVWKDLGAKFVKDAEVKKWKGMSPSLGVCGDKPNEIIYQNYWWYILKQRRLGNKEG